MTLRSGARSLPQTCWPGPGVAAEIWPAFTDDPVDSPRAPTKPNPATIINPTKAVTRLASVLLISQPRHCYCDFPSSSVHQNSKMSKFHINLWRTENERRGRLSKSAVAVGQKSKARCFQD